MATTKTVTVTNASVVTNDTLAGYNFYSDQDGKKNVSVVAPIDAEAGQDYSFTDGVVHQVTAKPVGTSSGEFTLVTSAQVELDLTTSLAPLVINDNNPTYPLVESPAGTFTGAAGATTLGSRGCNTTGFAGDFEFQIDWDDIAIYEGIALDAVADATLSFQAMDFLLYGSAKNFKKNNASTTLVPGGSTPQAVGNYMRFKRVGTDLTLEYYNGSAWTVLHTETGVSGTLYPYIFLNAGAVLTNPLVQG